MIKFVPPTPEELAERGLNPDGTPLKIKKPAKQPKAAQPEPQPAE